jgi:hypothetical protein
VSGANADGKPAASDAAAASTAAAPATAAAAAAPAAAAGAGAAPAKAARPARPATTGSKQGPYEGCDPAELFISLLPPSAGQDEVRKLFAAFGAIKLVQVPSGKNHAFVIFESANTTATVLDSQPLYLGDAEVRVQRSRRPMYVPGGARGGRGGSTRGRGGAGAGSTRGSERGRGGGAAARGGSSAGAARSATSPSAAAGGAGAGAAPAAVKAA